MHIFSIISISVLFATCLYFDSGVIMAFCQGKAFILKFCSFAIFSIYLLKRGKISVPFLVMAIMATISTLLSLSPSVSFMGIYFRGGGLTELLALFCLVSMIDFELIENNYYVKNLIDKLGIIVCLLTSAYCIIQKMIPDLFLGTDNSLDGIFGAGGPAFQGNHNIVGTAIALTLPATMNRKSIPIFLFCFIGLFLSGSRGAFYAFLIAISLNYAWKKGRIVTGLVIASMIIMFFTVRAINPSNRFFEVFKIEKSTRAILSKDAVNIIKDMELKRLLFGYGPETYRMTSTKNRTIKTEINDSAHNIYLSYICTHGIIFMLAWFFYFYRSKRNRKTALIYFILSISIFDTNATTPILILLCGWDRKFDIKYFRFFLIPIFILMALSVALYKASDRNFYLGVSGNKLSSLEKSVKIYPFEPQFHLALARAYQNKKRYGDCLKHAYIANRYRDDNFSAFGVISECKKLDNQSDWKQFQELHDIELPSYQLLIFRK